MAEYLCKEDMSTGEYISRDEALKIFHQCCDNCTSSYNGVMCRACADAGTMDILIDMPAADVQPVHHGRWIITDDVEHYIAVCSECGRTEDSRDIKDMPYCHCGARMVEPKIDIYNDTMNKEIDTLDRDALYNLICKVHVTFQEAANECHAAYDGSQDYYEGKAVAYEEVVYTIEQEMKKLYDAQRHI